MILGQFLLRRDTAANWTSANPLLLNGEVGLDQTASRLKIGDGITSWNSLAYFTPAYADAEVPTGLIDGMNTVFTLAHTPNPGASLMLFNNGMLLWGGGNDYTLAGNTITFVMAPAALATILAWYRS